MAITPPLQASGTMDYEELIATLKYLLDAAWGQEWGKLSPDGPNVTDPTNVQYPIITYYLKEMRPGMIGNNTREIKPRQRFYAVNDEVNGTQPKAVKIYGQVMDAEVVFEVWEETNGKADILAKQFRQTMRAYTGYFKEKGIKEIQFVRLENDQSNNRIRDSYKIRRLTYFVRFEEITEVPTDLLGVIDVVEEKIQSIAHDQLQSNETSE
jgi:hypothetical protein